MRRLHCVIDTAEPCIVVAGEDIRGVVVVHHRLYWLVWEQFAMVVVTLNRWSLTGETDDKKTICP